MIKILPNIITSARIIGTAMLLFADPLSPLFYIIYTLCGFSDVLDGTIARLTKNTTELGAKLDSVADILYYAVMLIKIFPILWSVLPKGIWYAVAFVILLRLFSYIVAAVKYRKFASLHTYLNKLTGAAVFTVPYFIKFSYAVPLSAAVCVIAGLASAEELLIHLKSGEYDHKVKSIPSNNKQKEA